MRIVFLTLIIYILTFQLSQAQQNLTVSSKEKISKIQDNLILLSDSIKNVYDDFDKMVLNNQFIKKFISALKIKNSFEFSFDSLYNITALKPKDNSFKIFTWFIKLKDNTYKYYGTIQYPTKDGSLKLSPLTDKTEAFKNTNIQTDEKFWYGARYYDIITVNTIGKKPYYVLLGWKGNNIKTNIKVIDVLSFNDNKVIFGKNIFEQAKKKELAQRIIFEYNANNTMTMFFDKTINMIVFDHLAPISEELKGQKEFYGSDSTFDGYSVNYSKFSLKEDLQLKNSENNQDEQFITPVKASSLFKKGKN